MPLTDACEMLTLVAPLLVRVTVCDCFDPVVTFPKFSLVGLSVNCPSATPVPVRDRLS